VFGEDIQIECCGSYRRGKPTCGDVDVLISSKFKLSLLKIVEHLESTGFLKERLQTPSLNEHGSESYMGVCKQDRLARRIDIKVYPLTPQTPQMICFIYKSKIGFRQVEKENKVHKMNK